MLEIFFSDSEKLLLERSNLFNKEDILRSVQPLEPYPAPYDPKPDISDKCAVIKYNFFEADKWSKAHDAYLFGFPNAGFFSFSVPVDIDTKEKKKGRPKKVNYVYRERSLYYARIQDITKLCELREYDLRGQREIILFLYRYYLCSFTEDVQKALEDVLELNSMFVYPLKENEVLRATRSAEKCYLDKNKEYKYKNDTLIELLEITEVEETYMTTIISKIEYKRRHREREKNRYLEKLKSEGKMSKKEELEKTRKKIKSLREKGFKNKEIMQKLGITSTTTFERHITYMRKNGLL